MKEFKTILITGASSGIGKALAEHYSTDSVNIIITGRNENRLMQVKNTCEQKGAMVIAQVLDVTNESEMGEFLTNIDDKYNIDLLIANAGISAGTGDNNSQEDIKQIKQIFDININGVINTISPIIPLMKKRNFGQIAIISSLASFRGMPSAPAYCASKAAVRVYGEGLRSQLTHSGIGVSVICPGFVKSGITDKNNFKMPFLMDANKAAEIIARGLSCNKGRISFPFTMFFSVWLLSVLPDSISGMVSNRLPAK